MTSSPSDQPADQSANHPALPPPPVSSSSAKSPYLPSSSPLPPTGSPPPQPDPTPPSPIPPTSSTPTHAALTTGTTTTRTLHIGTRASALALAQVSIFTALLAARHPTLPTRTRPISVAGDRDKTTNLHTLAQGGKSLWTEELEVLLLARELDCIVHSLKDVPTKVMAGCRVVVVGERGERRDCVVFPDERGLGEGEGDGPVRKKVRVSDGSEEEEGEEHTGWRRRRRLADLPAGAKVGTSSVRRAAMVRRRYPRLEIADVRGNVGTRLRKLDDQGMGFDAIILAGAGVQRLGLGHRVGEWLDAEEEEEGGEGGGGMLHAVGQGAIGVEIREGDEWVTGLLEGGGGGVSVIRKRVSWECMAERSLLRTLEGGCSVPVGVSCKWEDGKEKAPRNVPHDSAENSGNGTITTDGLRSNEQVSSTLRGGDSADTSRPSSSHTDLLPTSMNPSTLHMRASVTSVDGKECVQGSCRRWIDSDESADMLGWELARSLVEKGAGKILEKITLNRGMIERADGA